MTEDDLFDVIEGQAKEGVDFMTVHAGLTRTAIERLKNQGRVADVVSRGGAFHLALMLHSGKDGKTPYPFSQSVVYYISERECKVFFSWRFLRLWRSPDTSPLECLAIRFPAPTPAAVCCVGAILLCAGLAVSVLP